MTGRAEAQVDIDQQENARRERERARVAKLSGSDRQRAQELEDMAIQAFESERQRRKLSPDLPSRLPPLISDYPTSPTSPDSPTVKTEEIEREPFWGLSFPTGSPISPGGDSPRSTAAQCGDNSDIDTDHDDESTDDDTPRPIGGAYVCTFAGCTALPFQTQYLLNSHANVHALARPHYCPVKGCPRSEGGKGFKRKEEMIRHGLVHDSPGYICPFCPDRDHKYPRPDNLQR